MKQMLKTGKKALSVFMAVMMVLTAWVWVAPTEASAAAGSYYVKISYNVTDTADDYNKTYTGKDSGADNNVGISLFHKANNGTGTESEKVWDMQTQMKTSGTNSVTGTITGFPTSIYVYNNNGGVFDAGVLKITKIEIGSSSTATLTTLWAGTISVDSTMNAAIATLDSNYGTTVTDDASVSTTTKGWTYPYANTITWSNTPEAMTCPKTASDSAATQTVAVTAKDQYGVQMFDPTWSVKGSNKSDGITVSPATGGSTTISVTSSANIAGTTNSQTGTVTATWTGTNAAGTSINKTSSKTFTINDATYTATFKNHRNADGVLQSDYTTTAQYGVTPSAPTASDYSSGDYDYKFNGWNPTVTGITADTTYTAVYSNGTFVGADYTAVNEAIAAANAIKANYGTDYELKYTIASRLALDSALNAVVTGLGRTQQGVVDGYAQAINDAIAGLEPNKFDVIFLDKDGAILLYEKDVEYKEAVTAPSYSATYYDSTNHYTFTGWDTNEYTSVVDDLVIQPVFTAAAHSFTTETVPSTCVQKGATKYTCSCGYSYIDGETDYGDHVWATDYTVDLEPTCTVAGSKSIHCTLCDAQKDITAIDPLGHQWSSQSVAVEATCGKIGIMSKVCDDCGVCEHTIIPALEHDYKETVVAPTCTTKGYTEYTCQRADCGHSYRDNYTDVTAHNYGAWETVSEAHCEVAGVKKRVCVDCGFTELGSIDALEHDSVDTLDWVEVIAPTCEGKGYQTKTCSKCNNVIAGEEINKLGHSYTDEVVAPTCTAKGYTKRTCGTCGDIVYIAETAALNHAWTSTTYEADCTHSTYIEHVCGNDSAHNYTEYVIGSTVKAHTWGEPEEKAADCENNGYIRYECSVCGATKETILSKTGHSYGAWEVVKEATNDEDGQWKRVCTKCNDVEELTIPKGGHVWDNGTQTLAPTCKTNGTMVYKCTTHTDCGVTLEAVIPVTQHNVVQEETAATCTQPGSVKAYCEVCGLVLSTEEIPVKAHDFVAQTPVASTCTTSGYTPYTCACGATYNAYNENDPAKGHDFSVLVSKNDATCTADGKEIYKCSRCDEEQTTVLPKTGHNYEVKSTTSADCTTPATTAYECTGCKDSYTEYDAAANGHTWSDWTETQAATADNYGIKERTCSVCGAVEIDKIAPIGDHVFTETVTKPATCTEDGEKKFICSVHTNCTADYTAKIPATGHDGEIAYTAPTCTEEGSTKIICKTCGATVGEETVIPVIAHSYGSEVTLEAGCATTGTKTYTCSCGDSYTETIPAKGHALVTTVTDAKCGETGSVVTKCTVCDTTTQNIELAAKGHIWNTAPESTSAADCENDGSETYKCQFCDEKNVVVIPKLGHDWGEWTVIPSTNDGEGSISRTCSRGCTESVKIPAGGHELVIDAENSIDASCSAEGTLVYKCTTHTDCGITVSVSVPKTQHTVAQRENLATCTKTGSVEAYCSVCNAVLSTEEISVKAHEYKAGTPVAATCTTSGYTPYTCACGATYNAYNENEKATGHNYVKVENSSTATCTAEGTITLKCSVCNNEINVDVPALGHNYVEDTTAATSATCAAAATKTYKCSRCDVAYTISEGDKLTGDNVHIWGAWTVKESATATSIGYKTRVCDVCDKLEVETIPATGEHVLVETTRQPATCTEKGWIDYKCSAHPDCGVTDRVELPATGHTETLEYTPATCDETGSTKMVCSVCGDTIKEEEIPALGHLYGEGTVTNATCKDTGKIEYTCTRENCGARHETVIATNANAHQYETVVTDATCYKKGSVVTKCALCDDITTNKELPMIEHTWNAGEIKEGDAATCTTDGKKIYTCTVEFCGVTKEETVAKLGHSWSSWVKTDATNTADGEWKRTCSECGEIESLAIPRGHSLVHNTDESSDASCTAEGKVVYSCESHTDCGVKIELTLDKLQHKLETNYDKNATCEEDGEVVTKCKNCDTATYITVIPATGHTYDDGVTTAATCTATGKIVYTCTADGCGKTKEITLDKLQHNYVAGTPVAATCTSSGYTPYKCATCTSNYVLVTAPALAHKYVEVESADKPDCITDGTKLLDCEYCDSTIEVDVPALGHDYQLDSTTVATCAAAATETYECSRCGDSYTVSVGAKTTNHDWNDWVTVEKATNTSLGYKTRTCKLCDKLEVETIPATGEHVFDVFVSEKPATCTEAGEKVYSCSAHTGEDDCKLTSKVTVPATGHKEALEYVAATCSSEGFARMYCETCGKDIKIETISKLDHSWGNEAVTLSDCTNTGSVVLACEYAGCSETKTIEIPVNLDAHKLKTVTIPATCKAEGSVVTTCELCNKQIGDTVTLTKLQHVWGDWSIATDATNTTDGLMKRVCSLGCEDTAVIPAGGHEFGDTPSATTAATCEVQGTATYKCTKHTNCGITITVKTGYAEHTYATEKIESCSAAGSVRTYCTVCEKTFTTVTLGKLQHEYGAGVETAPTCTSSGYTTYTCEKCGASYKEIGADAKGHTLVESESGATCLEGGTIVLSCNVCNDYEVKVDVPALGHDYVEDKAAATEATCAAAATKTYKCSRCTASYTISVGDKTDSHSFNDWVTVEEASEVSLGYQTRTCSLCGKLEVKTLEAAGEHQFETGDITESEAATCTENGYEIRKCTVHEDCGKTATIVIPATGHDEEKTTVYASCTVAGSVTTTCKNCDYKEVEAIAELGHLYEAGTGAVTPATCDAEGKIEYTCTRCNGETKTVIIPVDADAHNYKTTVKQATCVADGSVVTECLICGDTTTETIPATGHSWNSGSVSKKATCEEAGLRKLTCLKCAATSDEVIPALGHTYEAGEVVAPTCTTSGYTVYACKNDENHKYNVYDETKPATGHTWSDWSIVTNATENTEGLKERVCACGEKDEQIIPAMKHEMTEIENVPSTCSQAGHITYKCKIDHEGVKCSYTLTVDLPLVAHALKTTVTEASCKDAGSVLTKCTVCDYETTKALALKPHELTVTTTAATCEGEGSVVEKCEVCGKTETTTIAALGHDFSGKETIVTPASCSDDGKKTIGCTRCDEVKEIIIPQTAHNFEPKEVVAATCTTSGYTVNRCACGREYNALDSDPIGHSWNKGEITKDATCTTDGEKTFTCTRDNCGATRKEVISKFGHSWGAWEVVVNPTATVDGLQMRKCLRGCGVTDSVVIPALGGTTTYTVTFVADGKVITTQTVVHGGSATAPEIGNKAPDANGHYSFIWDTDFTKVTEDLTVTAVYTQAAHNYGEWITDIEATCKAQGKQHRVCADCSYTQIQTVAVKSHDYSVVKSEKEATCTESGYTVRACSYCGTTTTETTMRLGHAMTYHEYIPETCDTDGSMAYYSCSRCGKNFADRLGKTELTDIVISKKYHTFIVSEGKDPTCTAEGVTDYLYCTSCGFTQNPSSIPALGHVDANKDNACDRCGGTYMEGGEIVCSCNCHKSGIFNELIYKILLFFWRLFGMNKSCACGRVHY